MIVKSAKMMSFYSNLSTTAALWLPRKSSKIVLLMASKPMDLQFAKNAQTTITTMPHRKSVFSIP